MKLRQKILVPGDISSAAYFIAAALLVPGSELLIKNVGTNPTRAGILEVCRAMGADITYLNENRDSGEPTADLLVRTSTLHGTTVEGAIIPTLIDEIPMIAVMAAFAEGTTIIRDAAELKVKETDRIKTTTEGLLAMGVDVTPTDDGMIIRGGNPVHGGQIMPDIYEPVTIFILAPGAFLVLAFLVAARNKIMKRLEAKGKKVVKAQGCCEGGCASCGGCDGHVFPTGQEKE